ncbi:MAG: Asp-tRNA(Asn)/Glu-tRNA(Gln) amidotransferase subunit GatB [Spirochaetia bacterium]|nr:Asp-tRNA(Asn)/Glu-tRNA(Gln) amidotransferase subunit GatB [Spirochaetia bacterium]
MRYTPTIGLEVHVQLNTKTKIFCSCKTSFGDPPNSNTCPVCLGLPGALPVLNAAVLTRAAQAALAIGAQIHTVSRFDRKNYFYPDLPKAYQISQFALPYCTNGSIEIELGEGVAKKIGVTRIHMEEDAGKLMHSEESSIQESYVDLNRAGTPLLEIVSEPEIDNSDEAVLYLDKLKSIMEYIEVSDCNMEQGSLRVDANVSIRPENEKKLGTRAEIKNLNSFKAVKAAIEYEIERQTERLENNEKIVQETRLWNALSGQTVSMRSKEEAHDYRYFPDPDLVDVILSPDKIQELKQNMPELAGEKKSRYIREFQIPEYDAGVLTVNKKSAHYFEAVIKFGAPPKKASNWIMSEMMAITSEKFCELGDLFPPEYLAELIDEIESGRISGKIAKTVFQDMLETKEKPAKIIQQKGLIQIVDEGSIAKLVDDVLAENPESIESYKQGKDRALGFLVGQVMAKSRGKANPPLVNKLLLEKLNK